MWFCRECGQENEGRFCARCGAEHIDAADAPQRAMPAKKSRTGLIIAIIAAAVILIGGATVAAVALIGGGDEEVATDVGTGVIYYVASSSGQAALYQDHNIESAVLAYLKNDAPVELLKEENSVFFYVKDLAGGVSGYMRQADLSDTLPEPDAEADADDAEATDGANDAAASTAKPSTKKISGDYYVTGTKNYLAIRSEPKSSADVEIGKTYNGNTVGLIEKTNGTFWYIYDYNSGLYGYVKRSYLSASSPTTKPSSTTISGDYYVTGTKNYLAIRSAPKSSADVEIGKTYNGNTVGLIEKTNGTFWYIYDYNSGLYGYVKCAYLAASAPSNADSAPAPVDDGLSDNEYRVSGTKNYLAIRSEPSSSEEVEIGKTYNGNVVQVKEKTNGEFWYIYDPASGLSGYVKCAYLTK